MKPRALAIALIALGGSACEGGGDAGNGLVVEREPISFNCTPVAGTFPPGLAVLSQHSHRAALVQDSPPGLWSFDLETERPAPLAFDPVGADSDGDGREDGEANSEVFGVPYVIPSFLGELLALRDDLALVSMSGYEQLLFYDPIDAAQRAVLIETPASFGAGAYPLLPPPGETHLRTGVSTLACVAPPHPFEDSSGAAIPATCDPDVPSYFTRLTAGKAIAAGRLFVATSNLVMDIQFDPGTVLVYEWLEEGGTVRVRPDATSPVLFTTQFNPTGVTRVVTEGGRELVLVTSTGVIGSSPGPGNVHREAAIEVIDPTVPRIAAVIPLGLAGPSFDALAVDSRGSIAWIGASSDRQVYAVDLRALDDPDLYLGSGSPAILDGTAGFPDARIFTGERPLVLPDRADGPPVRDCNGFTHVALNAAGSELFATDFCDGTFTRVRLDLSGAPPVPFPPERFQIAAQERPFAPSHAVGLLRAPGILRVRPGVPGVDYRTPDVLAIAGQPDAQLCALRVESR